MRNESVSYAQGVATRKEHGHPWSDSSQYAHTAARVITGACVHRWRLEEPAGAKSVGVCRYCRATRAFTNWTENTGDAPYPTRSEQELGI